MKGQAQTTRLSVKVSPKASRDAVVGWLGETLKVSVTAAPERGKANAAVIELLAQTLSLPRSAVRVARGQTDSRKLLEISGMPEGEILRRLGKPAA